MKVTILIFIINYFDELSKVELVFIWWRGLDLVSSDEKGSVRQVDETKDETEWEVIDVTNKKTESWVWKYTV